MRIFIILIPALIKIIFILIQSNFSPNHFHANVINLTISHDPQFKINQLFLYHPSLNSKFITQSAFV